MEQTDYMLQKINKNSDYLTIANYFHNKFPEYISIEDGKKLAEYLINNEQYTKEQILNGEANAYINDFIMTQKVKKSSIKGENEPTKEVPLKSKKGKITKNQKIAIFLSAISIVSLLAYNQIKKDIELDKEIDVSIGRLATEYGSEDYEYGRSIVNQNTFRTESGATAYRNDKIASDIIEVCEKNPELLNLTMINCYSDMKNPLINMDEVLGYLQRFLASDSNLSPQLTEVEQKIKDCDCFLDYIVAEGYLSPGDQDYDYIKEAIDAYKSFIETGKPFDNLSSEQQKMIQTFTRKYSDSEKIVYETHKGVLDELNQETPDKPGRV